MNALLCTQAGNLNNIEIIKQPTPEPKDHEVQIEVKAANHHKSWKESNFIKNR